MSRLETQRLILRRWRPADAAPFARMNADPLVMRYFPATLTPEESSAMINRAEAHFDQHGFGPFAAEIRATGEFAGFVALSLPTFDAHFTPCVEIGWRLAAQHWGQGLATEGARELLRHAFDNLNLPELVSFTVTANLPSRRVMEKLGMTHDAVDDFDHPRLPERHPFRRHVLYRLKARPQP